MIHSCPTSLLLCFGLALASAHTRFHERADTSIDRLYAFGSNISSLPLFYGDGQAFIGYSAPSNVSVATNVTFENSDSSFVATATDTTSNSTFPTTRLYIDTADGAFNNVGFTSSENSNSTATTSGYLVFGSLVMWKSDEGELQSKWYASPTDMEHVYVLKWNVDNAATNSATPIVLKTHS